MRGGFSEFIVDIVNIAASENMEKLRKRTREYRRGGLGCAGGMGCRGDSKVDSRWWWVELMID